MGKFGMAALLALALAGAMAAQASEAQPGIPAPSLPYMLEVPASNGRSVYIEQVGSYNRVTAVQSAPRGGPDRAGWRT